MAGGRGAGRGADVVGRRHTLWFVDIKGNRIHAFNEATGGTSSFVTPEFAAFVFRDSRGGLICGLRSGLFRFDPASSRFDLIVKVDAAHPRTG